MIISCIGDSLTEGDYGVKGKKGIANVHNENYPYFTAESEDIMQPNDGLHFSETGYRRLAEYIASYLKDNGLI